MPDIEKLIRAHGFERVYLLDPDGQDDFLSRAGTCPQRLCRDIRHEYPWATSIMILVYAYVPFRADTGLPGYYIASNTGYHLCGKLIGAIEEAGYRAERFEPPIKALLAGNGVGKQLRNPLIALPGLGTRTVFYAVATDCADPVKYESADIADCGDCELCVRACPFGAIDKERGYDMKLCARTYMESANMPAHVSANLPGLLGCELCQAACPRNKDIGTREPEHDEAVAFELGRLANGDLGAAKALVGKNMCTKGRLQAQARALLAKR